MDSTDTAIYVPIRSEAMKLRSIVLAAMVLCLSAGCRRGTKEQPLIIRVAVDPTAGVSAWLFGGAVRFDALLPRSVAGRRVQVATMLNSEYSDFLASMGPDRRAHIVIIGFDVERDSLKRMSIDPNSEVVLSRIPMVLLKGKEAPSTNSLKELLYLAKRRKSWLSQASPVQHSSGLAALALEAYAARALSTDGQKVDTAALQRLLSWLPSAIRIEGFRDNMSFQNVDVAVVSEDQCATATHEQPGFHGSYPVEGTLEISYRAYLAADLSAEERTAAQQFLAYMQSREMEELKKNYAIGKKCRDAVPPSVFTTPSMSALRVLVESWNETIKQTPGAPGSRPLFGR